MVLGQRDKLADEGRTGKIKDRESDGRTKEAGQKRQAKRGRTKEAGQKRQTKGFGGNKRQTDKTETEPTSLL